MKTNSNVRIDASKNRIYLVLEGFHDVEEALRMKKLYKSAIDSCKPGFTVLADVSAYKPGSDQVQAVHAEAVKLAEEAGVRKVARVVGEMPLGGMQINRIAKKEGHYQSAHFETLEEAEEFLDE
jgi:nucleotide-binding universal stress UspA family protein